MTLVYDTTIGSERKAKSMTIKPTLSYCFAGQHGGAKMDVNATYHAVYATNQPRWKERGLIFADLGAGNWAAPDMLLKRGEYTIVD